MKRLLLLKSQEVHISGHEMHFRKFALIIGSNLVSCIEYSLEEVEYQVIFGTNLLVLSPQRNLIQGVWENFINWDKFQWGGQAQKQPDDLIYNAFPTLSVFQIQTLTVAIRLEVFSAFCSGALEITPFYHIHSSSVTKDSEYYQPEEKKTKAMLTSNPSPGVHTVDTKYFVLWWWMPHRSWHLGGFLLPSSKL